MSLKFCSHIELLELINSIEELISLLKEMRHTYYFVHWYQERCDIFTRFPYYTPEYKVAVQQIRDSLFGPSGITAHNFKPKDWRVGWNHVDTMGEFKKIARHIVNVMDSQAVHKYEKTGHWQRELKDYASGRRSRTERIGREFEQTAPTVQGKLAEQT